MNENTFMMCPTQFLSICMISLKIILDMFSMRTRYIAVKAAIRYKKDGNLTKSVFFDANNLHANYLLASSIATATATVIPTMGLLPAPDNRQRASLQAPLASEPRKIAPRALCVTQHSAKHTESSVAQRRCE